MGFHLLITPMGPPTSTPMSTTMGSILIKSTYSLSTSVVRRL